MIERLIPDMTFQESLRTQWAPAQCLSVAPAETHQTSRLLSATTSPNVLLHKSIMASAAVPGYFHRSRLRRRTSGVSASPTIQEVGGWLSQRRPAHQAAGAAVRCQSLHRQPGESRGAAVRGGWPPADGTLAIITSAPGALPGMAERRGPPSCTNP